MIAHVPYAGTEDVDRAVRAAREAFDDGRWSGISAAARTGAMLALADAIEANADELAELESLDNGKPVKLAKRVDVKLAAEHIRYFASWPTHITGEVLPVAQRNMHCYTRKEPVGVAGQIIPWNFPLLMAAWKIGPGARGGLHGRAEARRADAAHRAAARRAGARGRPARGRPQRDHRATAIPARRSSITRASTRSPSPARRSSAARSAPRRAGRSSA